jgi:proteasome lid subunit RPN8/RPN11
VSPFNLEGDVRVSSGARLRRAGRGRTTAGAERRKSHARRTTVLIRLDPIQRARLARFAIRAYPREACGVLVGRRRGDSIDVDDVLPAGNLAARADRFELDPGDLVAADRDARARGLDLVGVWHSHPDAEARPSPADVDGAFGGWAHVIASIAGGALAELRAFRIQDGRVDEETIFA